jgi:hypothetical protein
VTNLSPASPLCPAPAPPPASRRFTAKIAKTRPHNFFQAPNSWGASWPLDKACSLASTLTTTVRGGGRRGGCSGSGRDHTLAWSRTPSPAPTLPRPKLQIQGGFSVENGRLRVLGSRCAERGCARGSCERYPRPPAPLETPFRARQRPVLLEGKKREIDRLDSSLAWTRPGPFKPRAEMSPPTHFIPKYTFVRIFLCDIRPTSLQPGLPPRPL